MLELQKAVSEAERKAHEMISSERAKMERTVAEAKRQAAEDALSIINQQEDSSEVEQHKHADASKHANLLLGKNKITAKCQGQWRLINPGILSSLLSESPQSIFMFIASRALSFTSHHGSLIN